MDHQNNNQRLHTLMDKFIEGTLSEDEEHELNRWYDTHKDGDFFADYPDMDKETFRSIMFENVLQGAGIAQERKRYPFWLAAGVAAALLLVAGIALYRVSMSTITARVIASSSIRPSDEEAIIQLSDGKIVDIAQLAIGDTAIDKGMTIYKNAQGEIVYKSSTDHPQGWNTVRSPAGVVVRMVLPDGSRVALNASSTLRYSLNMLHDDVRRIELDGEAYFTVQKKQDKQPFVVRTGTQEVQVLGTVFNVAAYRQAKDIKTSLQEGSVAVKIDPTAPLIYLKPTQQAVVQKESLKYAVRPFDANTELDWVNTNFVFDNEPLISVLKRVADWYQLQIDVPTARLSGQTVYGAISRTKPLNEILEVLEQSSGIAFIVQQDAQGNKRLTIQN